MDIVSLLVTLSQICNWLNDKILLMSHKRSIYFVTKGLFMIKLTNF